MLVGTAETLAAFERELPERIRERVIAGCRGRAVGVGRRHAADGVVEARPQGDAEREKEDEHRAIDQVVGQALRGGLACSARATSSRR